MMADMKASQQKLDDLVAAMNQAPEGTASAGKPEDDHAAHHRKP